MEIKVHVDAKMVADALSAAIEYGSTYWARYKSGKILKTCLGDIDHPIIIEDFEGGKTFELSYIRIERGLKSMAEKSPKHFGDLIDPDGVSCDAFTYDALLQHCCFGELVYG
jgi:hypothetical protein